MNFSPEFPFTLIHTPFGHWLQHKVYIQLYALNLETFEFLLTGLCYDDVVDSISRFERYCKSYNKIAAITLPEETRNNYANLITV